MKSKYMISLLALTAILAGCHPAAEHTGDNPTAVPSADTSKATPTATDNKPSATVADKGLTDLDFADFDTKKITLKGVSVIDEASYDKVNGAYSYSELYSNDFNIRMDEGKYAAELTLDGETFTHNFYRDEKGNIAMDTLDIHNTLETGSPFENPTAFDTYKPVNNSLGELQASFFEKTPKDKNGAKRYDLTADSLLQDDVKAVFKDIADSVGGLDGYGTAIAEYLVARNYRAVPTYELDSGFVLKEGGKITTIGGQLKLNVKEGKNTQTVYRVGFNIKPENPGGTVIEDNEVKLHELTVPEGKEDAYTAFDTALASMKTKNYTFEENAYVTSGQTSQLGYTLKGRYQDKDLALKETEKGASGKADTVSYLGTHYHNDMYQDYNSETPTGLKGAYRGEAPVKATFDFSTLFFTERKDANNNYTFSMGKSSHGVSAAEFAVALDNQLSLSKYATGITVTVSTKGVLLSVGYTYYEQEIDQMTGQVVSTMEGNVHIAYSDIGTGDMPKDIADFTGWVDYVVPTKLSDVKITDQKDKKTEITLDKVFEDMYGKTNADLIPNLFNAQAFSDRYLIANYNSDDVETDSQTKATSHHKLLNLILRSTAKSTKPADIQAEAQSIIDSLTGLNETGKGKIVLSLDTTYLNYGIIVGTGAIGDAQGAATDPSMDFSFQYYKGLYYFIFNKEFTPASTDSSDTGTTK